MSKNKANTEQATEAEIKQAAKELVDFLIDYFSKQAKTKGGECTQ